MITGNPYAVYVRCDAGMNYNPRSTGGVGISIEFPEHIGIEDAGVSVGRYEGANIERLEIEAIIQGMRLLLEVANSNPLESKKIDSVIVTTDRLGLSDSQRTNPFRLRAYRANGWKNHEGKEIKNSDLLDTLDKLRIKVSNILRCRINIYYEPRESNRTAHFLAKMAKSRPISKRDIGTYGQKIGKRKLSGREIDYKFLNKRDELIAHVIRKDSVGQRWEIVVEIFEGRHKGSTIKIYSDNLLEQKIHRHHIYKMRVKEVFSHHIEIFRTITDLTPPKNPKE